MKNLWGENSVGMKHHTRIKSNAVDLLAFDLARQWATQTYTIERWCQHCHRYQQVRQKERDEVCLYICVVCENTIDEKASPF